MTARYVRSYLLPLGGWCAKMSVHGTKASLELPADMVAWVSVHFAEIEKAVGAGKIVWAGS